MCRCEAPTINGSAREFPVSPPEAREGEEIVYDLPGRCGGVDMHAYHFRIVRGPGFYSLRVRHGGGEEKYEMGSKSQSRQGLREAFELAGDDNARYWLASSVYFALRDTKDFAIAHERERWRIAAREGRLRLRSRNHQKYAEIVP